MPRRCEALRADIDAEDWEIVESVHLVVSASSEAGDDSPGAAAASSSSGADTGPERRGFGRRVFVTGASGGGATCGSDS